MPQISKTNFGLPGLCSECLCFHRMICFTLYKKEEVNEGGPDLWWGSSAYRAEPTESSSVGKPEPKDNLRTRSNLLNWITLISHEETRQTSKLTKVGFIGTTLQTDAFGTRLDQEVPHQLISYVTNWKIYFVK